LPGPDKRLGEIYRTKNLQDESVPPALSSSKVMLLSTLRLPHPFFPEPAENEISFAERRSKLIG
jgi:hypothetical protein